jgi:hypothetical protein
MLMVCGTSRFTESQLTILFRVGLRSGMITRNEYEALNHRLLIEGDFPQFIRRAWKILPGRGSRRRSETPHA